MDPEPVHSSDDGPASTGRPGATLGVMVDRPAGGASLRTPMGYEAFLALGETKHHEFYDGLCVVNPPTRRHSRAQASLVGLLQTACPPTHEVLTGWGWHVGPELDVEPDIMITDRAASDDDVLRNPPPLLVVEISSPSTRDVDLGRKRHAYAGGGADWYWIVDLEPTELIVLENLDGEFVEVQRLMAGGTTAGPSAVLFDPGALAGAR